MAQLAPTPAPTRTPSAAATAPSDAGGLLGGFFDIGDRVLGGIVQWAVTGAVWVLGQVGAAIDASTRPDVSQGWFTAAYDDMVAVAAMMLLPLLVLAVASAAWKGSLAGLARATAAVPAAALGSFATLGVVDALVRITDELSAWLGRSIGGDLTTFATTFGAALARLDIEAAALVGFLAAAAAAFLALVLWIELLLRQAAIYTVTLFVPLAFASLVWPAIQHWLHRLIQVLLAVIFSKVVITAVVGLGTRALLPDAALEAAESASVGGTAVAAGLGVVVSGIALLLMAVLAPYALLRLIPVWEAGLSSQLEGTLRRPTAASASPVRTGGTIQRLFVSKLAGGSGTVGSAGAAGTASGAGPGAAVGTTAVKTTTGVVASRTAVGGSAAASAMGAKSPSASRTNHPSKNPESSTVAAASRGKENI